MAGGLSAATATTVATGVAALLLCGVAMFRLVWLAMAIEPLPRPHVGQQGLRRHAALQSRDAGFQAQLFRGLEPCLRYLGACLVAVWPACKEHVGSQSLLRRAGDWCGLSAPELWALHGLCAALFAATATLAAALAESTSLAFVLAVGAIGFLAPYAHLLGEVRRREIAIHLSLPGAIDLAALCMGAGFDFVGALQQIVQHSDERDPLRHELVYLLQQLELGSTRKQALLHFADRVRLESVRDFVGSVVQAEERGSPLAEVLQIQATTSRLRRSVRAEEAAARAGVWMMLPLAMMFACILLIVLGPFVVEQAMHGLR